MKEGKIFNCCMATAVALAVNFAPTFAFGACDSFPRTSCLGSGEASSAICAAYGGTLNPT